MSEEKIAEALGLRPLSEIEDAEVVHAVPTVVEETNVTVPTTLDDEVVNDIEVAKANIEDLISKGSDSLDSLLSLAKQSESPRAFEVVSTMVKTLIDANKEFVAMSEKKKYAKEDHPAAQTNITNNNLILSTTDILKMLKGDKEG
jgi:hypothetical protein